MDNSFVLFVRRRCGPGMGLILFGLLPAALLQNILFAGFHGGALDAGKLTAVSIDEITSIVVIALLVPSLGWFGSKIRSLPLFAPRRLAFLFLGFGLFTFTHIGGMIGLRSLAHGAMGHSYNYTIAFWPCGAEVLKDAASYAILLAVLALFRRHAASALPEIIVPVPLVPPSGKDAILWVKTRRGQRRVALATLMRVTAAGNYVELLEEETRLPLGPRFQASVEAELNRA